MSGTELEQELSQAELAAFFGRELLGWYDVVKRKLPWRINRDPYRVWVSEIMLQQTRVDTVIPYYERFMQRFPTVQALAEAPEEDVLKHWEGLGYYSRARNLQAGAREVVERYNGIVPDDAASVASLKGVGPYTAGAIMSIAFNRSEPAVDGNVMRVLSRFWLLEDDIAKPATRVKIEKLARSIIPEGRAGDFNQALMELGALVCTPKSPGCLTCPVMEHCAGRLAGREAELPIKTKAKPPRPEWRLGVVVEGSGENAGRVLVRQRPDTGLLARMWELPHVLVPKDAEKRLRSDKSEAESEREQASLADLLARMLHEEAGLLIRPLRHWTKAEHVFSHIHWHMDVFEADLPSIGAVASGDVNASEQSILAEGLGLVAEATSSYEGDKKLPSGYAWIGPEAMDTLAFPNLFLKLLQQHWGIKGRG
ncbi:A/G-specific adenine glycosylase [Paenibacillus sp. PR3]|uniref:Adenine DNA glycosylase n=1 Tax=Paenibacillus terricola TaxID=2763503 RepID=A0ABR8N550_9BACL|nr:A/G-specific adenine glycosylase [Paenibacillus terricola]MBD3921589.1 A/G-specific adenine glycosylase [Paenibacillus terricola]